MKGISRSLVYAVALPVLSAALAAGGFDQARPFTLILVAPKESLKAGQQLLLHVKVTSNYENATDFPVSCGGLYGPPGQIYRVHVLDGRRRPIPPRVPPPSPRGKHVTVVGSTRGRELQPGQSMADKVDVTDLYDLRRPGKYTIWIAEPYYRGPGLPNGLVRSNTITVTVIK